MKNITVVWDTIAKWESLLRKKNDFVFAEALFDGKLFKDAMKQAFDIFCQVVGKETLPVSSLNMSREERISAVDCCKVIQFMSDYASDCFVGDESKDLIFTASQYAVRLFLNKVIWSWSSFSGDPVLSDDMEFCDDERSYSYNVETGDLSDLQKLVKYRETWD